MFRNIRQIVSKEGPRALFKGISASLMGLMHPIVYFPLYEQGKRYIRASNPELYKSENDKLLARHIIVSTVFSKIAASLASYPHEVLRSRL